MPVVVRILGPLGVEVDGTPVPLRGAKRRGMLALLAARASTLTPLDSICDAIWPDDPIEAARRSVQTYVSQLRRTMTIVTSPAGYQLDQATVAVDAFQFERLAAAVVEGDVDVTSRQLEEALGLWRGPALVEFADQDWAQPLAAHWEELRRHAEDQWFAAQRAAGFGDEVIPRLEAACAAEPLRESRWAQLILALTDAGRPAEALRAYGRVRATLRDELGVSPSPALQDLQLAVLRQEPVISSSPKPEVAAAEVGQVRAMLLSDIEGSTRLLQRLGPEYSRVLERHRRIVRSAIGGHGGVEEGTDGDSFFVTFATAMDAVRAAVEIQWALAAETWPADTEVRVRVGVHVGEVTYSEAGMTGLAVHQAARVAATAHGGQIVLTDIAHRLVGDAGDGIGFVGLGEYVVRDVGRIALHQVVGDGLGRSFPPLRTDSVSRSSVPVPWSSLIGRDGEVDEVVALLGAHRLVTLTGAGGCGKTRLAMAVSATIPDVSDVWFVELADVTEGSQVLPAVAATLGVPPSIDAVAALVGDHSVLLVFDNCEHLLDDAGSVIESLLQYTSRASVLATSRARLAVAGEALYRVPSLRVPPAGTELDELVASDAVRLFEERAALVRSGYRVSESDAEAVRSICEHLDGIPLAVELAAARTGVMTPAEIDARLGDRFRLLGARTRAVASRQRTLQTTVEWSYRLLTATEQAMFELLAIFPSGFTLDAAVAVSGDGFDEYDVIEAIGALNDKSLLDVIPSSIGTRFRFLETIRQYAHDRFLARDDVEAVRDRHARHFHDLGERLFQGPRPGEFGRWHAEWSLNVDNIVAAADWLIDNDPHRAIELLWAILFLDDNVVSVLLGAVDERFERIAEHTDLAGTAEQCWARAVAHDLRSDDAAALTCVHEGIRLIGDSTPAVVRVSLQLLREFCTSAVNGSPVTTEAYDRVCRLAAEVSSPLCERTVKVVVAQRLSTAQRVSRLRVLIEQQPEDLDDLMSLPDEAVLLSAESVEGPAGLLERARACVVRLRREPALLWFALGLDLIEAEWGDPQRALAISSEYVRAIHRGARNFSTLTPYLGFAAHVHRLGEANDSATELADELLRLHPPEQYHPFVYYALGLTTRSALYRDTGRPELAARLLARTSLKPSSGINDAYARICDEAALVAHELGDPERATRLLATGTDERRQHGYRRSPWLQLQIEPVATQGDAEPLTLEQVVAVLQSLPSCSVASGRLRPEG